MDTFTSRLKRVWNVFNNPVQNSMRPENPVGYYNHRSIASYTFGGDNTIMSSIKTRIAIDVAQMTFAHVRCDENERYKDTINSTLNECLTVEANVDQTGPALIQDAVESLLDEGVIAIAPIETSSDIRYNDSYDIYSLRVGKITDWFARDVRLEIYNDRTGKKEMIVLPKSKVAIITNPLYSVMNEPNSTYKRLVRKLALLDSVDEEASSGKLDLILNLPYSVKGETRKLQAETRIKDLERQLKDSRYGIAYIDATEHVTPLNRSLENNLLKQIEYLTSMLYSQLGLSQAVFDGTADETVMNRYYQNTPEPIADAIVNEMTRKFLTKTARTQGQKIMCYRDPFKFVPMNQIADMADKFTRNEIMSSNEFRQSIGLKASDDPGADVLRNKNLSMSNEQIEAMGGGSQSTGDNLLEKEG